MAYLCVYAALLHDVGSILVDEPQSVEEIEREERHVAQVGAAMLRDLPEFSRVADVIENCRCPWQVAHACAASSGAAGAAALLRRHLSGGSGVDPARPAPAGADAGAGAAQTRGGRARHTLLSRRVGRVLRISRMEFVWLDVAYNPKFLMFFTGDIQPVLLERTVVLTQLMSRLIDFRSPFTAMHSAG